MTFRPHANETGNKGCRDDDFTALVGFQITRRGDPTDGLATVVPLQYRFDGGNVHFFEVPHHKRVELFLSGELSAQGHPHADCFRYTKHVWGLVDEHGGIPRGPV